MSRGRHCARVDLGAPYGVVIAQLIKPRDEFTDAEWQRLVADLRDVNAALTNTTRPAAVVCRGPHSDPHPPIRVELKPRPGDEFVGAVYECPTCQYDVSVDCELTDLAPNATMIELHHLAQLVTAHRQAQP